MDGIQEVIKTCGIFPVLKLAVEEVGVASLTDFHLYNVMFKMLWFEEAWL
jgi:hypothetical protein